MSMGKKTMSSPKAALASYMAGFVLSLALTVTAYLTVVNRLFQGTVLIAVISSLAIAQLVIQLVFFLHLSNEPKPRWNLRVLLFAVLVVVIVVFGSLWIMTHLSYNHGMSPEETNSYIEDEEAIHR